MDFLATTRSVPIEERKKFWDSVISRHCGKFALSYPEGKFEGTFDARKVSGIPVARVRQSCCTMRRDRHHIACDDQRAWLLIVQMSGSATFHQCGRSVTLSQGQICLLSTALPLDADFLSFNVQMVMHLPDTTFPHDEQTHAKLAARFSKPVALLANRIISSTFDHAGLFDDAMQETLLGTLRNLILGGPSETAVTASATDNDELYREIQNYICENVMMGDLTPAMIARQHNMSERKLYRIFSSHGVPPTQYIRKIKLHQAAIEIGKGSKHGVLVTQLAYKYGFSDASNFSRAFRSEFGISPREFQQEHMRLS